MLSLKNILLLFGITGIAVFIMNDVLYYRVLFERIQINDAGLNFLEHIIIGWLIFISTILTFILLYREKKQ
tara:strand:- start:1172 stop:1384 length:213 start_codon:yes stop_codon:yes gene_type:complete